MKQTLQVLLQLREEGALAQFAIGGAVVASFYIEAVATEDLDIFAFLQPAPGGLQHHLQDRWNTYARRYS